MKILFTAIHKFVIIIFISVYISLIPQLHCWLALHFGRYNFLLRIYTLMESTNFIHRFSNGDRFSHINFHHNAFKFMIGYLRNKTCILYNWSIFQLLQTIENKIMKPTMDLLSEIYNNLQHNSTKWIEYRIFLYFYGFRWIKSFKFFNWYQF